jgi:hypothetical protein
MSTMRAMLAFGLILFAASVVHAQTIMGGGMRSCGDWLRFRSFESGPKNTSEVSSSYQLQAWLDGYLSGFNRAGLGGIDFLASQPSGAALTAWVDNYCRSKPLNVLADAAEALIRELRSRARQ